MRYLLVTAFLLFSIILSSQERVSAGLELNYPFIADFNNNTQHLNFNEKPGCSIHCNYEIPIVLLNNLSVSFGLNLNLLRFERKFSVDSNNYLSNNILPVAGNNSAYSFNTPYLYNPVSNTTVYYIGLPIELSYSIIPFKLDASLGINSTWLLYNIQRTQYSFIRTVIENGQQYSTYGTETKDENKGLNKSVTYINLGMSYNVYEKIYITAGLNCAITPLYENSYQLVSNQYPNIITIGAKYYFWQYK
jgi:hypothetical protein